MSTYGYTRIFTVISISVAIRRSSGNHRALPGMCHILDHLLVKDAPLRRIASTLLHVCKFIRANRHNVAESIAGFSVATTAPSYMPLSIRRVNWPSYTSRLPTGMTVSKSRTSSTMSRLLPSGTVLAIPVSYIIRRRVRHEHQAYHHTPSRTRSCLDNGRYCYSTNGPRSSVGSTT